MTQSRKPTRGQHVETRSQFRPESMLVHVTRWERILALTGVYCTVAALLLTAFPELRHTILRVTESVAMLTAVGLLIAARAIGVRILLAILSLALLAIPWLLF